MIALLIYLLILCVVLWILHMVLDFLLPLLGLPAQVKPILLGIIGLIALVLILQRVGLMGGAWL